MYALLDYYLYSSLATGTRLILASVRFVALFLRTAECFLNDDGDGSEKVTNKVYSRTSVYGHLCVTATHFSSRQTKKKPFNDSCLKPLHNGHLFTTATFFCPQGGLCRKVQLYVRFVKLHLFFSNFSST